MIVNVSLKFQICRKYLSCAANYHVCFTYGNRVTEDKSTEMEKSDNFDILVHIYTQICQVESINPVHLHFFLFVFSSRFTLRFQPSWSSVLPDSFPYTDYGQPNVGQWLDPLHVCFGRFRWVPCSRLIYLFLYFILLLFNQTSPTEIPDLFYKEGLGLKGTCCTWFWSVGGNRIARRKLMQACKLHTEKP